MARLVRQIKGSAMTYDVIINVSRDRMLPPELLAKSFPDLPVLRARVRSDVQLVIVTTAFPSVLDFPAEHHLYDKRVLVVREVWHYGHTVIGVMQRAVKAEPLLVHSGVLFYKPERNVYPHQRPTYFVEATDDDLDYPRELFDWSGSASTPTP